MAQPATTAKIEELRFKLKTDPKSRLFYQLAEELRKAGHFDESEHVLRTGLVAYPTYLAAWVSLGRTLREQKNDAEAVDALNKALQLDPGNVVAARILADAYLALGQKIEAIKKYKLVHALLPSDEDLRVTIERLERDLQEPSAPLSVVAEPEPELEPTVETPIPKPLEDTSPWGQPAQQSPPPFPQQQQEQPAETVEAAIPSAPAPSPFEEDSPFDRTLPPFAEAERSFEEQARTDEATGDVEPMTAEHEESPFEEPVSGFTSDAFAVEAPAGMHIEPAPMAAEVSAPIFDTDQDFPEAAAPEDAANTVTMADLYVRQGLVEDARHIYESILARDPGNAEVRGKLEALAPRVNPKVAALERWLGKVSKREVGRV
ncbi:MAG TPA: tetratricopeptide repeat protein [Thermoanaerobaculia bacterium]|nr:tetratricopeptide repeat protein [Thermoanaerobaculia bacterium]